MADLERFVAGGVVAQKRPEPDRVRRWLDRSRKDLRTAMILGADWATRLRRLDSARRFRHETLYGDVPTASDAQLTRTAADVASLVDELADRLRASPSRRKR